MSFAGYRLPVPGSVITGKPGLDGYFGKKIILGIRPSDFEDGAFADDAWPRITVTTGVTEGLGTEIHVIFTIDAPYVQAAGFTNGPVCRGGFQHRDDRLGSRPAWRRTPRSGR